MRAISRTLSEKLFPEEFRRLIESGYMSPQGPLFTGQGFACNDCDWLRRGTSTVMNHCTHPSVRSLVENAGCCNRFTYKGVHT